MIYFVILNSASVSIVYAPAWKRGGGRQLPLSRIIAVTAWTFDFIVKTRLLQWSKTSETRLLQHERGSHHRNYR